MSPWIRPRLMNGPFIIEHGMKFEFISPATFSNEKVGTLALPACSAAYDAFLRNFFCSIVEINSEMKKVRVRKIS